MDELQDMFAHSSLLSAFLVLGILAQSLFGVNAQCIDPSVRKEWRSLTVSERAEWIRAVKVSFAFLLVRSTILTSRQCLSKLPHDPHLTATINPDLSVIPPINASGSFYDGKLSTDVTQSLHSYVI